MYLHGVHIVFRMKSLIFMCSLRPDLERRKVAGHTFKLLLQDGVHQKSKLLETYRIKKEPTPKV